MAFAALGVGVGVRILSYGLAGGAAVILNQYGTSTKEMFTEWLYSKFKTTTAAAAAAAATDIIDDDVGRNDEGSNAATDINDQQAQEEKAAEELIMIKEEEEEIIEKEVIHNKSATVSEELFKVTEVVEENEEPTAEALTDVDVSVAVEVLLIPSPLQNINEQEHGTSVLMMKIKQDAKKNKEEEAEMMKITQDAKKKKEEEEEEEVEEEMMEITQDAKKKKEEEMMEITQDAKKKKEEEEEEMMKIKQDAKKKKEEEMMEITQDAKKNKEEEEEMMKIKQNAKKKKEEEEQEKEEEEEEEEEESLWMRVKELISKISDRAKRGVRGLEEWCCYYLKDPDFWDGKKGRIPRAVIGVVADCLFEGLTGNKGLRSTVFSKTLLRRLYNILKTNIM